MHLVITTREDPGLSLARFRARGQLTELRVADLRFTPSEAAEFLNQVMGLKLSPEDVAALESRTEGWIAGLQLAALSMKGHQDVSGFIQGFAGDNRYIVEYLMEEVLQRQPESTCSFLLQSSILERLNGPLCDAVTGQTASRARLETLQRGNFFLIPLDDKRHWYRYHHLFVDVLRLHLMAEQPDQVPTLHNRASEWYEQNGSAADAIHHALAAENFERAADLIEQAVPEMRRSRQESALLGWLRALPDKVIHYRPMLSVHYAGALLLNGKLEGVEFWLQDAERWLETTARNGEQPIVRDEKEFHSLPGWIASYRAAIALALGNVDKAIKYAQQALDHIPEEDDLGRGAAAGLLGIAHWTLGNLDGAYRSFADGLTHLQRAGHISDAIGSRVIIADIRIAQGQLRNAMRIYERGWQLAKEHGTPTMRGTADMYVGISELEHERNNLDAAVQNLSKSKKQGEHTGFPRYPFRWRVAMAEIQDAKKEFKEALELLDEAERRYIADFSPDVRPIPAMKARILVKQGRLDEALSWAHEKGLSDDDDLSYLREYEHITLARILLAQYKNDPSKASIHETLDLLERLLKAAERGGRVQSVIEILVLQALAHQMQDDIPTALASLERALALAEPEEYIRIFVDEGADMAALLNEATSRGVMPNYVGKLLSAFDEDQSVDEETPLSASPVSSSLIEPLSQRELEILRLFKTELSGPEIARELVIALSTVRTHTKSIYNKLDVNSRRSAVKRAVELGLI